MTSRYIANNTDAHVQANQELADKIMSLIQAPDQGNPKESAGAVCKTDAKVKFPVATSLARAKEVAYGGTGDKAQKAKWRVATETLAIMPFR
jgi:hypothetical protein